MATPQEAEHETMIQAAFVAGDLRRATTLALEAYGEDVLRFLSVRLQSRAVAEEAFSEFCEDLWGGLSSFSWRSTAKTWIFTLARHAGDRCARSSARMRRRLVFTEHDAFRGAFEPLRTTTALEQRTETKLRLRALRARLHEDQQNLLVLRVDRKLGWKEIALIMAEVSSDAGADDLARAAARIRTRFQATKRTLRELARREGLLQT